MEKILIRPPRAGKKKKILGRGSSSGKGGTATRGNKGAKSRSGYSRRIGFEGGQMPLIRRMPKKGFTNGPFKKDVQAINLDRINQKFNDNETVSLDALKNKRLVHGYNINVKILGKGEFQKKLVFDETLAFSE
ncbi:MAG TPA: 50S ribosomal protein L15 [Spirochaetia bacterium]|nr:50S ribosomal protein L15 [Spirochaetia bacterium]